MLAEVERPEHIAFTHLRFCRLVAPPPVVTVHVPEGVAVQVDAPEGVEVRRV